MDIQEKDKNVQQELYEQEKDILLIIMKYRGWDCVILRHAYLHHLNGYINIPQSHSLYKTCPSDFPNDLECLAHGGFTFVNDNLHVGVDCIKTGWWIGFDCAHGGDYFPKPLHNPMDSIYEFYKRSPEYPSYKNIEFVRKNLHYIVDSLIEYEEQHATRTTSDN